MEEQRDPMQLPIIIIVLFLQLLPSTISSQSLPATSKLNIFILAGQSNMAGRGGVRNKESPWDGVVPSQCQPNPYILRLTSDLAWVLARDPLHADIDLKHTNGVGPGMAFANAVLTRVPEFGSVGLVPCAVGGTRLRDWEKGGLLYRQMVRRAKVAADGGGVIKAVVWYQGESDTVVKEDADSYKERLFRFFSDLRSDLQDPTLPIIQVALASGEGPYVDLVREAQHETGLSNVLCVDAKGLPLEPDRLHLTTSAQVRLGQLLADEFLNAAASSSSSALAASPSSAPPKFPHLRLDNSYFGFKFLIVLLWTAIYMV